MTIASAFANAVSGLTAAARGAQVVSSNLSNALNENYARRSLELSARLGNGSGGVRIDSVARHMDLGLMAEKRLASAEWAGAEARSDFLTRLETLFGTPQDGNSLSARIAAFESSLVSAASRPDSPQRLDAAAHAAGDVAATLRAISQGIQDLRGEADKSIATTVTELNSALEQVEKLNLRIARAQVQGNDSHALKDQRQALIGQIGEIIPLREIPRDRGMVALITTNGATLLDGKAAVLEFTPSNAITPHMRADNGLLSGLILHGRPVDGASERGPVAGGKLAALFEIRDGLAVTAQEEVDAFARDMIERFQASGLDTTRAPGAAGLFSDNGAAFDPVNETGIAGRVTLNAAVDPDQGTSWRLRDGLGATAPGPAGDGTLLQQLKAALSAPRPPGSGGFAGLSQSSADLSANLLSDIASQRQRSEQSSGFAATRLSGLREMQLADGVDSDHEMQRLMQIEQAYGANARMLQTLDEMMQTVLRL